MDPQFLKEGNNHDLYENHSSYPHELMAKPKDGINQRPLYRQTSLPNPYELMTHSKPGNVIKRHRKTSLYSILYEDNEIPEHLEILEKRKKHLGRVKSSGDTPENLAKLEDGKDKLEDFVGNLESDTCFRIF